MIARFEGGPADGYELALVGKTPSYLMLMEPPESISAWPWIIVGAGFDDRWPGQLRYELHDERLEDVGDGVVPTVVYRFTPAA